MTHADTEKKNTPVLPSQKGTTQPTALAIQNFQLECFTGGTVYIVKMQLRQVL